MAAGEKITIPIVFTAETVGVAEVKQQLDAISKSIASLNAKTAGGGNKPSMAVAGPPMEPPSQAVKAKRKDVATDLAKLEKSQAAQRSTLVTEQTKKVAAVAKSDKELVKSRLPYYANLANVQNHAVQSFRNLTTEQQALLEKSISRATDAKGMQRLSKDIQTVTGFSEKFTNNLLKSFPNPVQWQSMLSGEYVVGASAKVQASRVKSKLKQVGDKLAPFRDITSVLPMDQIEDLSKFINGIKKFDKPAQGRLANKIRGYGIEEPQVQAVMKDLIPYAETPKTWKAARGEMNQHLGAMVSEAKSIQKAVATTEFLAKAARSDKLGTVFTGMESKTRGTVVTELAGAAGVTPLEAQELLRGQSAKEVKALVSDLQSGREAYLTGARADYRKSFRGMLGRPVSDTQLLETATPQQLLGGVRGGGGVPPGGGSGGGGIGGFMHSQAKGDRAGPTIFSRAASVGEYAVASQVVGAVFSSLSGTIKTIKDVDTALTQLNKVLGTSKQNLEALKSSAVKASKDYGINVTEVLRGYQIFAQQGLPIDEVQKRGEFVAKAANVSDMGTEELSEVITAGLLNFGDQLGNSGERLLDSFLAVEQANAVTESDLAEISQRIGAQASSSGLSIHELNALGTIMKERTRERPAVIATAMRFFLKNLFDPANMKDLNEQFGIEFQKPGGDVRSPFDILQDMATIYPTLNKQQQRHLALQVGETRNVSRFMALMQGFGKATDIVETSQGALGTTNERNQVIMGSLEKQLDRTKASLQGLALAFGEQMVGPATSLLSIVSAITDNMSQWGSVKIPGLDAVARSVEGATGTAQGETSGYSLGNATTSLGIGGLAALVMKFTGRGSLTSMVGGVLSKVVPSALTKVIPAAIGGFFGGPIGSTLATIGATWVAGEVIQRVPQGLDSMFGDDNTFDTLRKSGTLTARQTQKDLQEFNSNEAERFLIERQRLTDSLADMAPLSEEDQIKRFGQTFADVVGKLVKDQEQFTRNLVKNTPVFDELTKRGMVVQGSKVLFPSGGGGLKDIYESTENFKAFQEEINNIQKSIGADTSLQTAILSVSDQIKSEGEDFAKYREVIADNIKRSGGIGAGPLDVDVDQLSKREAAFVGLEVKTGRVTDNLLKGVYSAISRGSKLPTEDLVKSLPEKQKREILDLMAGRSTGVAEQLEKFRSRAPGTDVGGMSFLEKMALPSGDYIPDAKLDAAVVEALAKSYFESLNRIFSDAGKEILPRGLEKFAQDQKELFLATAEAGQKIRGTMSDKVSGGAEEVVGEVVSGGKVRVFRETQATDREGNATRSIQESIVTLSEFFDSYQGVVLAKQRTFFADLEAQFSKYMSNIGFGANVALGESGLKVGGRSLTDMSALTAGTFGGFEQGRPTFNTGLQRVFIALQEQIKKVGQERAAAGAELGVSAKSGARRQSPQEEVAARAQAYVSDKAKSMQIEGAGLLAGAVEGFGKVIQTLQAGADEFRDLIHSRMAKALVSVVPGLQPRVELQGGKYASGFSNIKTAPTTERELDSQQLANMRMPNTFFAMELLTKQRETQQKTVEQTIKQGSELREAIQQASPQAIYQLNLDKIDKLLGGSLNPDDLGSSIERVLMNVSDAGKVTERDLTPAQLTEVEGGAGQAGMRQRLIDVTSKSLENMQANAVQGSKATESQMIQYNEAVKGATALADLEMGARSAADSLELISRTKVGSSFKNLERSIGLGAFGLLGKERSPITFSQENGELRNLDFSKMNQFQQQRKMIQLLSSEDARRGRTKIMGESGEVVSPLTDVQAEFQKRVLKIRERRARQLEKSEVGRATVEEFIGQGKNLQTSLNKFLMSGAGTSTQRGGARYALQQLEQIATVNPRRVMNSRGELNVDLQARFKDIKNSLKSSFKDVSAIPGGLLSGEDITKMLSAGVISQDKALQLQEKNLAGDPLFQETKKIAGFTERAAKGIEALNKVSGTGSTPSAGLLASQADTSMVDFDAKAVRRGEVMSKGAVNQPLAATDAAGKGMLTSTQLPTKTPFTDVKMVYDADGGVSFVPAEISKEESAKYAEQLPGQTIAKQAPSKQQSPLQLNDRGKTLTFSEEDILNPGKISKTLYGEGGIHQMGLDYQLGNRRTIRDSFVKLPELPSLLPEIQDGKVFTSNPDNLPTSMLSSVYRSQLGTVPDTSVLTKDIKESSLIETNKSGRKDEEIKIDSTDYSKATNLFQDAVSKFNSVIDKLSSAVGGITETPRASTVGGRELNLEDAVTSIIVQQASDKNEMSQQLEGAQERLVRLEDLVDKIPEGSMSNADRALIDTVIQEARRVKNEVAQLQVRLESVKETAEDALVKANVSSRSGF